MNKYFIIVIKIVAAFIMIQTLYFKFTGAQESINLFTKIAGENEALMRIGTGIVELIASILLFIPKSTWLGALLTIGLMFGAIFSHLTILGIEFNGDGGALFYSAVLTFIIGLILLYHSRKSIAVLGKKF